MEVTPTSAVPSRSVDARSGGSLRSYVRSFRSGARNVFKVLRANPLTLVGFILVVFLCLAAVLIVLVPAVTGAFGRPVYLTPYGPNELLPCPPVGNQSICEQAPSGAHWFGTDRSGRDVFSRVVAALPLDLAIGFLVAGFSLLVGGGLGLIAGFWDRPGTIGGALSLTIMRVTDVFLAFPSLVLALAIAATLGRGTVPSVLAIRSHGGPSMSASPAARSSP